MNGMLKKKILFETVYFTKPKSLQIKEYFITLKGQTPKNGKKK